MKFFSSNAITFIIYHKANLRVFWKLWSQTKSSPCLISKLLPLTEPIKKFSIWLDCKTKVWYEPFLH